MNKREEIEPNKGDKRYIRRDGKGRFTAEAPSKKQRSTEGRQVSISHKMGRSAGVPGYVIGEGYPVKSNEAKPSLGDRLRALRQKIVESGQPLLSWDEINDEAARRRGKIE